MSSSVSELSSQTTDINSKTFFQRTPNGSPIHNNKHLLNNDQPLFTIRSCQESVISAPFNRVILDQEIDNAFQLTIKEIEGNLFDGNVVTIDASGMNNSLRQKRDGLTFFGFHKIYVR